MGGGRSDDSIGGVAWLWPETAGKVTAHHDVHPEHRGLGLGDVLLDAIEARAAQLPPRHADGTARKLVVWSEDSDVVRRAMLDAGGFSPVRQYYEMAIDLDEEPAPASWPPGSTLGCSGRESTTGACGRRTSRRSPSTISG